jgi:hypothetical protein
MMAAHVSESGDVTWHLYAQRFFASAAAKAGLKQLAVSSNLATAPQRTVSVVAVGGNGFVAWDNGSALRGIWTDALGNPRGGTLALPGRWQSGQSGQSAQLAALLDGSVVLQVAGNWAARVAPLAQSYGPAPSWLSTRRNTRLGIVRGGNAYALTFPPSASGPQHLALFAPAGNRCGGLDLAGPSSGIPFRIDLGGDGSVIVAAEGGANSNGTQNGTCRWELYRALLH